MTTVTHGPPPASRSPGAGAAEERAAAEGSDRPIPTRDDAEAYVAGICFKIGPPVYAGVELERLVYDCSDPTLPVPLSRLTAALGHWSPLGRHIRPGSPPTTAPPSLPAGSAITIEPGGQVEVSTRPFHSIGACLDAATVDLGAVGHLLAQAGLALGDSAIDPFRPPRRVVDAPRYAAMERYFDQHGSAGRTMMAGTTSVQLSVDAGTETGPQALAARWSAAYALGPVLVAMFANSPTHAGVATGWRSARQRVWGRIDAVRGAPPSGVGRGEGDPRAAYARYALDAPLLCLPRDTGCWDAPSGVTFADWITDRTDSRLGRRPTYADLDYHLTTLFPPVRAKGYLEVRYLDSQPGDGWRVPMAVLWALLADDRARDAAREAAEPVAGEWVTAARDGLSDARLARAARAVLAAALGALPGCGVPAAVHRQVTAFADRYTFRGRCPADDHTEEAR